MIAILAGGREPLIASDDLDLIELNHFHDEQGRPVFDQIIYYDWSPAKREYIVRDWRLHKSDQQLPVRDFVRGGVVATWHDGEILRRVRAKAFRETWTQFDPELTNREITPKELRRLLAALRLRLEAKEAGR